MEKKDDIHQNFEITEQFIREYCSRTELETKARDAALLLLKQLEECRKLADKKQEETKQEDKKEEVKEKTQEEDVQQEKEEPVISEEKFKKLQNAKQGKKTYREYLRNQLKTIGMAGVIAMSTAVYSQSQIVYKNGIIMYAVLEKEFPILNTIKNLFAYNTPQSNQSLSNNTSNNGNNSVQSSAADSSTTTPVSNTSTTTQSNTNTNSSVTSEQSTSTSSTAQLTPAEQEQIKKGEKILEDEAGGLNFKLQQFNTPIAPPKTTNTDPSNK